MIIGAMALSMAFGAGWQRMSYWYVLANYAFMLALVSLEALNQKSGWARWIVVAVVWLMLLSAAYVIAALVRRRRSKGVGNTDTPPRI